MGCQAPEALGNSWTKMLREQVSREVVKRWEAEREVVSMTQKCRVETVTKLSRECD